MSSVDEPALWLNWLAVSKLIKNAVSNLTDKTVSKLIEQAASIMKSSKPQQHNSDKQQDNANKQTHKAHRQGHTDE